MTSTPTLRVLIDGEQSAEDNMAIDRALLEGAAPLTLRFYQWKPWALSLGHFQKLDPQETSALAEAGIPVVRRLTGGGAIFHADELTYSLTGPDGEGPFRGDVEWSYTLVHSVFTQVLLREYGVKAVAPITAPSAFSFRDRPFLCFARSAGIDLQIDGDKILGSAKRRRQGRALQHGSLILRAHPRNATRKGLIDHAGQDVEVDLLASQLAEALAQRLDLTIARP